MNNNNNIELLAIVIKYMILIMIMKWIIQYNNKI